MKNWIRLTVVAVVSALIVSCTTSYDYYGRPQQSVDPTAAAVGALAIGALAYSAGKSDRRDRRGYYSGGYSHHYHYDPCY